MSCPHRHPLLFSRFGCFTLEQSLKETTISGGGRRERRKRWVACRPSSRPHKSMFLSSGTPISITATAPPLATRSTSSTHTHKAPAASYTPWSVKRKGWQRGDNRKPVRSPRTIGAVCRSPEREVQSMKGVERENNKRDELKPSCTFTWLPS